MVSNDLHFIKQTIHLKAIISNMIQSNIIDIFTPKKWKINTTWSKRTKKIICSDDDFCQQHRLDWIHLTFMSHLLLHQHRFSRYSISKNNFAFFVTYRVNIFGFWCVLHTTLCGRHVFSRESNPKVRNRGANGRSKRVLTLESGWNGAFGLSEEAVPLVGFVKG